MADLKRRIVAEFSAKNKAKGIMSGFRRDMDTTGRAMRRMAAGALAVAGIGGMGYMIKKTMESIDVIAKLSDRLGITTEDLVGLQHAASISGVSTEALNKSLEMFTRRLGEMTTGSGEAQRGLEMLGLTTADLIRLSPAEAMGIAADKINRLETQAEKAAAAYFLFGRAGAQLVTMFAEGSEGLREFQIEAEKLGLTFSRFDAGQIEAANDALTRARAVLTGLFRQATIELAPYIEVLADKFVDVATSGEGMGANVVNVFEQMSLAAIRFGSLIQTIPAYWKGVEAGARETLAAIYEMADAATNLDVLFKKLKRPGWEKTYKELAEEQREIGAGLFEAAGADLAAVMQQESGVQKFYADLRTKAAGRREALEAKAGQRMAAGPGIAAGPGPVEKQTEAVESAERRKMQALQRAVDVEIQMLGRLNEPRQHARQLIQFEAAAMEEFDDNAQKAAAAVDVFRGKLEELEEAQKWAEVAKTMEQSFAGALDRLSQDWKNYGEVAKGVLREILLETMRIMMWRPMAQAAAGWIQMGLSGLGQLIIGGGTAPPALTTPRGPAGMGYQHGGIAARPHLAMVGEVPEAIVPLSGGRSIPVDMRGEAGPPSFTFIVENQMGQPMRMEKQRQGVNPREFILTVVADDAVHGGVLSDIFQTRQG